ncbi:hypothetical protein BJX63DRAFT_410781 [Aspergillus granulosus]|uniref:Rhodopsin domain-containing protein n=1 Tax=Aspergillus granulosus TaxID=176169 RepID=A0ABR4GXQ5_9EURO
MRVFPTPTIRKFGLGIIIFLFFTISGELPLILQYSPVRAAYDPNITGKCLSPDVIWAIQMYQGVVMICVDIYIFILPIPATWKLQMSRHRRLSIIGLFGIGSSLLTPIPYPPLLPRRSHSAAPHQQRNTYRPPCLHCRNHARWRRSG